jgi:hypothetical protein
LVFFDISDLFPDQKHMRTLKIVLLVASLYPFSADLTPTRSRRARGPRSRSCGALSKGVMRER